MDGSISPINQQQKHFVAVCRNLAEPETEWERIWKSYWSTIEEEKRLEAIHREKLRHSPEVQEYLDHRWLGETKTKSTVVDAGERITLADDRAHECRVCRGSGMKADGDSCDRCNGRGWIQTKRPE